MLREVDVVVIGAGVAGLACARMLSDAGTQVIVWEGRSRIGGRVHTFRPSDGAPPIELGAQVVHGDRNPLWSILDSSVPTTSSRNAKASVLLAGRSHPITTLARGSNPPWTIEDRLADRPDSGPSVADRMSALSLDDTERGVAAEWLRQRWGAEPDQLSADGVITARAAECTGSGEYLLLGGFHTVAQRLADGLDIALGHHATEITWSRGSVRVRGDHGDVRARAAVVTVPPTVVASGRLRIDDLPGRKFAAARQLRLGDALCAVITLSDPLPDAAVVFDADGRAGFLRAFAGRREVLVVGKARAASWLRAALLQSTRWRSLERIHELLRQALPDGPGAEIERIDTADWGADACTGGAFTSPRIGSSGAPAAWADPLGSMVFFAGEATCEPGEAASVHGAMRSGRRAAAELMESARC